MEIVAIISGAREDSGDLGLTLMSRSYFITYLYINQDWIVINTKTGKHSHFRSEYGCYLIKKFIRKNIFPENPYLQESYRRLTESKKEYKQRYININRGIR